MANKPMVFLASSHKIASCSSDSQSPSHSKIAGSIRPDRCYIQTAIFFAMSNGLRAPPIRNLFSRQRTSKLGGILSTAEVFVRAHLSNILKAVSARSISSIRRSRPFLSNIKKSTTPSHPFRSSL